MGKSRSDHICSLEIGHTPQIFSLSAEVKSRKDDGFAMSCIVRIFQVYQGAIKTLLVFNKVRCPSDGRTVSKVMLTHVRTNVEATAGERPKSTGFVSIAKAL